MFPRLILISLLPIFLALNTQAQDVLLFPESTFKPSEKMSVQECMSQCDKLMSIFRKNGQGNLLEKLKNKVSNLADLHENPAENMLANLNRKARQLVYLGKHEIAAEIFKKIVAAQKRKYGVVSDEYADAIVDLARADVLLIRYSNARGLLDEALSIYEKNNTKKSFKYVTILNELAQLKFRGYEFVLALNAFKDALTIIREMGKENTLYHAILLNNIGACQTNLKDYNKAIDNYQAALAIVGNKYPREKTTMGANLGESFIYVDSKEKAIATLDQYYKLGEKTLEKQNLTDARVWAQFTLGYMRADAFGKAENTLKNAFVSNSLTIDKVVNIPDEANDLMFDNEFLATCGQAQIMMYSMELYRYQYLATNDIKYLEEGYKIIKAMSRYGEKLMNSYESEDNKLKLFRLGGHVLFDRAMFYAYKLHEATGDKRYLKDAFFWSERSKSILLVNALSAKDNQEYINLPQVLQQEVKTLKNKEKVLEKQFIEAKTKVQKEAVVHRINEHKLLIEDFKNRMKVEYPQYYQHRYDNKIVELATLQDKLTNNQIVLQYFLGTTQKYVLMVTKRTVQFLPLAVEYNDLTAQAALLRKSLSDYKYIAKDPKRAKANFQSAAHYFYKTFIAKLLDESMEGQHLVIIPDGVLGHVPFEVFLTNPPQQKDRYATMAYLIKDYTISYSYSASIFMAQQKQSKKREVAKKGILAFAAEYENDGISATAVRSKRGADIAAIRKGLAPLPGAKQEVELLQKHLYGAFYNGVLANEEAFKKTAKDYGIIHLAMHGVLDNRSPILSSLVFSEDTTSSEDNFLRAYEIAQLDLNADLVVLSACETGYGKFQQGEGIMSLAHSFTYAGASSVLMSLWQVNDYSTGAIMKSFYTYMAKGYPKDKALQKAKLRYIQDASTDLAQHPAFWAAFVQQGNNEPLKLVAKTGLTFQQMGGIGIVLILALIAGGWRWSTVRKQGAAA